MPGLHLGVLWAFAIAQPLFDVLGDTPAFFVARENTRLDIVVLALVAVVVGPLILLAIEAVALRVSPAAQRNVHSCFVALLTAIFALQVLTDLSDGPSALLILAAAAIGVAGAVVFVRAEAGRALLTVLSPAPLVFLVLFLAVSPVSRLVLEGSEVEAAEVETPSTPVVVIVFDALTEFALEDGSGQINASRFPSFAALAKDSTWYRNANTVADFTDRAVPALLTGERPARGDVPTAASHPESLFTLLGGSYSVDVTEPVTDVCPESLCGGEEEAAPGFGRRMRDLASDLGLVSLHLMLPDDVAERLPPVDRSFGNFRELDTGAGEGVAAENFGALVALTERERQFADFLRRLRRRPPAGRHLTFLHVALPHDPYSLLPTGQRYPETLPGLPGLGSGAPAGVWGSNEFLARQAFQRYLLQLGYADRMLGRTLSALKRGGAYDKALVVVTADHGVNFESGESHRAGTRGNLPQIAGIPLFVKAPGQREGRTSQGNVPITDVLATIADELGIALPWETDGRPAARAENGGEVRLSPQSTQEDIPMPFGRFVRRRDALARQMVADFGTSAGELFSHGTDADLVGRRTAALGPGPSDARFELDAAGLFSEVDPRAPVVPAFVTGTLTGVQTGARLAVSVAGRVAAVGRPFDDGDTRRFAVMVPPSAFAAGDNAIEVLTVTGSGFARRLSRLRGARAAYRLVKRSGRESIVDPAGRRIRVAAGAVDGAVESLSVNGPDVRADGWAGGDGPADRVLAFSQGRFLAAVRPRLPRPDLKAQLARAGFRLTAGLGTARDEGAPPPVDLYAIQRGRASRLRPPTAP